MWFWWGKDVKINGKNRKFRNRFTQYSEMISDKGTKAIQERKDIITNSTGTISHLLAGKKKESRHRLHIFHKN